jgi:hypothetical protein
VVIYDLLFLFKADGVTREAAESLVGCYRKKYPDYPDSIFFAEDPVSVFWGHMSVLDADLVVILPKHFFVTVAEKKWHKSTLTVPRFVREIGTEK